MEKRKKLNRRTFPEITNSFVKMQTNLFFVSFSFEQIDETANTFQNVNKFWNRTFLELWKKIETANIFQIVNKFWNMNKFQIREKFRIFFELWTNFETVNIFQMVNKFWNMNKFKIREQNY